MKITMQAPLASWRDVYERDERIRQLERLNSRLAAEIDLMRPVIETALKHGYGQLATELGQAVHAYETAKRGQQ